MSMIEFYGYENKTISLKNSITQGEGFLAWLGILFLAGFTPLPYKAFTIASGLVGFNLLIFVIASLISRSLRFFIIAYLSYKFGDLFTQFMKKNGSNWFTVIGILILLILGIMYFFHKFNA
jgi:LPXTG-motif cell wall-anchored protein